MHDLFHPHQFAIRMPYKIRELSSIYLEHVHLIYKLTVLYQTFQGWLCIQICLKLYLCHYDCRTVAVVVSSFTGFVTEKDTGDPYLSSLFGQDLSLLKLLKKEHPKFMHITRDVEGESQAQRKETGSQKVSYWQSGHGMSCRLNPSGRIVSRACPHGAFGNTARCTTGRPSWATNLSPTVVQPEGHWDFSWRLSKVMMIGGVIGSYWISWWIFDADLHDNKSKRFLGRLATFHDNKSAFNPIVGSTQNI